MSSKRAVFKTTVRKPGTLSEKSGQTPDKDCSSIRKDSNREEAEPLDIILRLWKTGFILNDGPFREFKDPHNREVFATILKSDIPEELQYKAKTRELFIKLQDRSDEEYSPITSRTLGASAGIRFKLRKESPLESRCNAKLREMIVKDDPTRKQYTPEKQTLQAFGTTGFRKESPLESRRNAKLREMIVKDDPTRKQYTPEKQTLQAFGTTGFRKESPLELRHKAKLREMTAKEDHTRKQYTPEKPTLEAFGGTGFRNSYNEIKKLLKEKIYASIDGQEKSAKFPEIEEVKSENCNIDETEISYNEIKKLLKEKIYASIDGQEKSAKFPEIEEVKSENCNIDETEILKIKYQNEARSLGRDKEKQSVEIERLTVNMARTELKRTETARQMVIEKNRNSEIKLHNERRELYAQQKINDIEESIKRR